MGGNYPRSFHQPLPLLHSTSLVLPTCDPICFDHGCVSTSNPSAGWPFAVCVLFGLLSTGHASNSQGESTVTWAWCGERRGSRMALAKIDYHKWLISKKHGKIMVNTGKERGHQ